MRKTSKICRCGGNHRVQYPDNAANTVPPKFLKVYTHLASLWPACFITISNLESCLLLCHLICSGFLVHENHFTLSQLYTKSSNNYRSENLMLWFRLPENFISPISNSTLEPEIIYVHHWMLTIWKYLENVIILFSELALANKIQDGVVFLNQLPPTPVTRLEGITI